MPTSSPISAGVPTRSRRFDPRPLTAHPLHSPAMDPGFPSHRGCGSSVVALGSSVSAMEDSASSLQSSDGRPAGVVVQCAATMGTAVPDEKRLSSSKMAEKPAVFCDGRRSSLRETRRLFLPSPPRLGHLLSAVCFFAVLAVFGSLPVHSAPRDFGILSKCRPRGTSSCGEGVLKMQKHLHSTDDEQLGRPWTVLQECLALNLPFFLGTQNFRDMGMNFTAVTSAADSITLETVEGHNGFGYKTMTAIFPMSLKTYSLILFDPIKNLTTDSLWKRPIAFEVKSTTNESIGAIDIWIIPRNVKLVKTVEEEMVDFRPMEEKKRNDELSAAEGFFLLLLVSIAQSIVAESRVPFRIRRKRSLLTASVLMGGIPRVNAYEAASGVSPVHFFVFLFPSFLLLFIIQCCANKAKGKSKETTKKDIPPISMDSSEGETDFDVTFDIFPEDLPASAHLLRYTREYKEYKDDPIRNALIYCKANYTKANQKLIEERLKKLDRMLFAQGLLWESAKKLKRNEDKGTGNKENATRKCVVNSGEDPLSGALIVCVANFCQRDQPIVLPMINDLSVNAFSQEELWLMAMQKVKAEKKVENRGNNGGRPSGGAKRSKNTKKDVKHQEVAKIKKTTEHRGINAARTSGGAKKPANAKTNKPPLEKTKSMKAFTHYVMRTVAEARMQKNDPPIAVDMIQDEEIKQYFTLDGTDMAEALSDVPQRLVGRRPFPVLDTRFVNNSVILELSNMMRNGEIAGAVVVSSAPLDASPPYIKKFFLYSCKFGYGADRYLFATRELPKVVRKLADLKTSFGDRLYGGRPCYQSHSLETWCEWFSAALKERITIVACKDFPQMVFENGERLDECNEEAVSSPLGESATTAMNTSVTSEDENSLVTSSTDTSLANTSTVTDGNGNIQKNRNGEEKEEDRDNEAENYLRSCSNTTVSAFPATSNTMTAVLISLSPERTVNAVDELS